MQYFHLITHAIGWVVLQITTKLTKLQQNYDSNLHISIQVCTFHDGCKQGIDQQIFNRKSISRKITHPQSWKLQAEVTAEKKQTQDYNRNVVIQSHES